MDSTESLDLSPTAISKRIAQLLGEKNIKPKQKGGDGAILPPKSPTQKERIRQLQEDEFKTLLSTEKKKRYKVVFSKEKKYDVEPKRNLFKIKTDTKTVCTCGLGVCC